MCTVFFLSYLQYIEWYSDFCCCCNLEVVRITLFWWWRSRLHWLCEFATCTHNLICLQRESWVRLLRAWYVIYAFWECGAVIDAVDGRHHRRRHPPHSRMKFNKSVMNWRGKPFLAMPLIQWWFCCLITMNINRKKVYYTLPFNHYYYFPLIYEFMASIWIIHLYLNSVFIIQCDLHATRDKRHVQFSCNSIE